MRLVLAPHVYFWSVCLASSPHSIRGDAADRFKSRSMTFFFVLCVFTCGFPTDWNKLGGLGNKKQDKQIKYTVPP